MQCARRPQTRDEARRASAETAEVRPSRALTRARQITEEYAIVQMRPQEVLTRRIQARRAKTAAKRERGSKVVELKGKDAA
jgi:hypothetical protein